MKIRNLFVMLLLGGSLIFSGSVFTGCASWSNTGKGAAIGAGSGAALDRTIIFSGSVVLNRLPGDASG